MDSSGRILIPGIYDHVAPLTDDEKGMYEAIDLDLEEYRNSSRVKTFLFDTKVPESMGVGWATALTRASPVPDGRCREPGAVSTQSGCWSEAGLHGHGPSPGLHLVRGP